MRQVLLWWTAMLLLGMSQLPLANLIFRKFEDRGWLFSKTIGLFLSAWLLFVANVTGALPFTQNSALLVAALLFLFNCAVFTIITLKAGRSAASVSGDASASFSEASAPEGVSAPVSGASPTLFPGKTGLRLILLEEALFFFLLAVSVYVIGFRPEAYGTEKFMDYAFMTSMMRSLRMPFLDPWYAGETINYYYGGQYIATFLTKLTGVTAGEGYNLMRALVTACSFMLPFSLVTQLLSDRLKQRDAAAAPSSSGGQLPPDRLKQEDAAAVPSSPGGELPTDRLKKAPAPGLHVPSVLGGLLGGTAVAFCGNFHYVIFGIVLPIISRIKGEYYNYWFPDSTRYIGYNPDLPDKTIHEFPAYSSVLGDLHAHYLNICFVVTVAAIAFAWAKKHDREKEMRLPFLHAEVWLIGIMTGAFRWTNYWDFPIYFVVSGSIFFFVLLRTYRKRLGAFFLNMGALAAVLFLTGYLASLPFTVSFFKISSEIGFTHSHTRLDQLLILWGLPAACLAFFAVRLFIEHRERLRGSLSAAVPVETGAQAVTAADTPAVAEAGTHADEETACPARDCMPLSDLVALLYGLCAAGLVFLPEVIYVKDIYSGDHYRANTMFKLTYQAFILFGIVMAYILVRALVLSLREKRKMRLCLGLAGLAALLLTSGYIVQSCASWFGNIFIPANRVHTDASVFVSESFPSDFAAINYLNTEVSGQPFILEAQGNSYTGYERVSVATGLPTVAGWRVHEWLWRENLPALDERIADVRTIYTSSSTEEMMRLIKRYQVSYIYIGSLEREQYPDINEAGLKSLGEIVFSDSEYDTYIIRVD